MLDLIGNTSLIRLGRIRPNSPDVEIYAKAEWENPGGSVKDRPALNIIREAEAAGLMAPDKILVDSTSGNTGIAYAMIGAARNFRVMLWMPSNVSEERKRILNAYGAEIVYTDPMEGSDGALLRVREVVTENPEPYFYANQYENPANWGAHYHTTAPEIFRANFRPHYSLCRRTWNQRHFRWNGAASEGTEPQGSMPVVPAGFTFSWTRRNETHAHRHQTGNL